MSQCSDVWTTYTTRLSLLYPFKPLYPRQEQEVIEQGIFREFNVGDTVYYKDVRKQSWHKGIIQGRQGSKVYQILGENGLVDKHVEQPDNSCTKIPLVSDSEHRIPIEQNFDFNQDNKQHSDTPPPTSSKSDKHVTEHVLTEPRPSSGEQTAKPSSLKSQPIAPTRSSSRISKPVVRLNYDEKGG